VQHERTGLVVPAGDPAALQSALRRLRAEPELRIRLGSQARDAVAAYTYDAWVTGMSRALNAVGAAK
jgi:glycosyltransferase involved in cell wall biosynthesis